MPAERLLNLMAIYAQQGLNMKILNDNDLLALIESTMSSIERAAEIGADIRFDLDDLMGYIKRYGEARYTKGQLDGCHGMDEGSIEDSDDF